MKLNLIINCAFYIVNCALLISCASNRPIATTHTERIEERVMPVVVGADTIEITEYRLQSTNLTPSPAGLPLKQGENKRGNQLSTKPQKHNSPILSPCIRGTSEAEGVKKKIYRFFNFCITLKITLTTPS